MADNPTNSPVSVNVDLTKPITIFIEKIASATGVLYEPTRIKKKAAAEAEAKMLQIKNEIRMTQLQRRAMQRLVNEEAKKQFNIESVISEALPQIKSDAHPEEIDDDWLANFFERAKFVSDSEMRAIWARLLAGEANAPKSFSRRTINLVAELEKGDAELFGRIADYVWLINEQKPLVFDVTDSIYTSNGLDFSTLTHLDSLGLITFQPFTGFRVFRQGQKGGTFLLSYAGKGYRVKVPIGMDAEIQTGKVMFTQQGKELYTICSPKEVEGLVDYVLEKIRSSGLEVR